MKNKNEKKMLLAIFFFYLFTMFPDVYIKIRTRHKNFKNATYSLDYDYKSRQRKKIHR